MNHNIPQYDFYKHKYGDELLIDVVPLNTIKKYLKEQPVHILTYYDITLITSGEGEFLIDHQAKLSPSCLAASDRRPPPVGTQGSC